MTLGSKVDVLIPCRTGGDRFLVNCIESVEAQYNVDVNVEVIFDDVGELANVRNNLLKRGTAEYVYYIDADDMIPNKNTLWKLVRGMDGVDFCWGDYESYVTPRRLTVYINQPYWIKGPAIGSWLARRESFPVDPWRPMSETEPHRADWITPDGWIGVYLAEAVYWHRVGWSKEQNSAKVPETWLTAGT